MFIRDGKIACYSVTSNGIKGFIESGGKKYYFRSDRECAVRFKTLTTAEFRVLAEPADERENWEARLRMREIRENLAVKFVDCETPQGVLWCHRHVFYRAEREAYSILPAEAAKYPFLRTLFMKQNIPFDYLFEEREISGDDLKRATAKFFIRESGGDVFYEENLQATLSLRRGEVLWPNKTLLGVIAIDCARKTVSLLWRKKLTKAAAA